MIENPVFYWFEYAKAIALAYSKTMFKMKGCRPIKGYHWFFVIATMILYTLNLELHHFKKRK